MAVAKTNLRSALENLKSLAKQAEEMGGPNTSHSSEDKDNHTEPTQLGTPGKETGEMLTSQVGPNNVNDATPPAASQDHQTSQQQDQGTKKTLVGGDPALEDVSGDQLPDPGSEHPARTDNTSLDGEKYASMTTEQMIRRLQELGTKIANDLLLDPSMGGDEDDEEKKASSAAPAAAAAKTPPATPAIPSDPKALAQAFVSGTLSKDAAYAIVRDQIAGTIAAAEAAAHRVADYLDLQQQKVAQLIRNKQAGGDPAMMMSPDSAVGGPGAAEMAATMGEGTSPPPEVLQALLGAQGAPTDGGEESPEGTHSEPDGDEDAAGNEPPMEEEGTTIDPQDAAQVEQLLAALGITPESLTAMPAEQKMAVAKAVSPLLGRKPAVKAASAKAKSSSPPVKKSAKEKTRTAALREFIESTRAV